MSEGNGTRDYPMDLFVLQPGKSESDPNTVAAAQEWGSGERWHVIYDVVDLVRHVKSKCGDKFYVRFLRIGGHGNTDRFRLGNTLISLAPLNDGGTIITSVLITDLEPWLKEIQPYLKPGESTVILDHCYVGQNDLLLKKLAEAFGGVRVIAPFDGQVTNEGNGVVPLIEGDARVCSETFCYTVNPSQEGMPI